LLSTLLNLMDIKHSLSKKVMHRDRIDPGTFSMLEPGWWVLHAIAITGVYLLGRRMQHR
jgi:hypothetical protein